MIKLLAPQQTSQRLALHKGCVCPGHHRVCRGKERISFVLSLCEQGIDVGKGCGGGFGDHHPVQRLAGTGIDGQFELSSGLRSLTTVNRVYVPGDRVVLDAILGVRTGIGAVE